MTSNRLMRAPPHMLPRHTVAIDLHNPLTGEARALIVQVRWGETLQEAIRTAVRQEGGRVDVGRHAKYGEWIKGIDLPGGFSIQEDRAGGLQFYFGNGLPGTFVDNQFVFLKARDIEIQGDLHVRLQYDPYLQDLPSVRSPLRGSGGGGCPCTPGINTDALHSLPVFIYDFNLNMPSSVIASVGVDSSLFAPREVWYTDPSTLIPAPDFTLATPMLSTSFWNGELASRNHGQNSDSSPGHVCPFCVSAMRDSNWNGNTSPPDSPPSAPSHPGILAPAPIPIPVFEAPSPRYEIFSLPVHAGTTDAHYSIPSPSAVVPRVAALSATPPKQVFAELPNSIPLSLFHSPQRRPDQKHPTHSRRGSEEPVARHTSFMPPRPANDRRAEAPPIRWAYSPSSTSKKQEPEQRKARDQQPEKKAQDTQRRPNNSPIPSMKATATLRRPSQNAKRQTTSAPTPSIKPNRKDLRRAQTLSRLPLAERRSTPKSFRLRPRPISSEPIRQKEQRRNGTSEIEKPISKAKVSRIHSRCNPARTVSTKPLAVKGSELPSPSKKSNFLYVKEKAQSTPAQRRQTTGKPKVTQQLLLSPFSTLGYQNMRGRSDRTR